MTTDNPLPRYTPDPTPQQPHAAPAPAAAEAGELTEADMWWIGVYDGALAERDAERCRAEAAEAERDRLALELAALRGAMPDAGLLDSAAVTIGFPLKSKARADVEAGVTRELREAAASIRALATATATPQAAGTGTGGVTP